MDSETNIDNWEFPIFPSDPAPAPGQDRETERAREQEQEQAEAEMRLYRAVKLVAEKPEGKILLDWLCRMSDYAGTAYRQGDAYATHFLLGKQDLVNRLMWMVKTPMEELLRGLEPPAAKGPGVRPELGGGRKDDFFG